MAISVGFAAFAHASPLRRAVQDRASPRHRSFTAVPSIRCMAEQEKASAGAQQTSSPPKSTKFSDVLAFGGPAPERINGRLAMTGFVTAVAVEAASGNDVVAQLTTGGGLPWFFYTVALLSVASLVPMFQGVSADSKSGRLMTSKAELCNGRAAMLGHVALLVTEYLKGGPLA